MKYPVQAVIFCGGLGTRLRPLTDSLPKPMMPILDKPFLEYLLQQLSEQGINRFVLLTGYLGEMIQEYFSDGNGVAIAGDESVFATTLSALITSGSLTIIPEIRLDALSYDGLGRFSQ